MVDSSRPSAKRVPALERGVRILDLVAVSEGALTAAEIARQLKLAKSSAHGLLGTLCDLGLLVRRTDQTYTIGPHVARWGEAFERQADVGREFTRIWDEATTAPGATITLSVLDGTDVVYIGARNSGRTPWVDFRVGMRLPAPFTATGMAIMSRMTNAEIRERMAPGMPKPLTPYSVTSVEQLLENVAEARARGVSYDDQQTREGMVCVGAPILNAQGRAIAGVAASFPTEDLDGEVQERLAQEVQQIAHTLSVRMGASPYMSNTTT